MHIESAWGHGPTTAWVDIMLGVVFVHVDLCAALGEGMFKGDKVLVQGRGYRGSGQVIAEGRTPEGRVHYHVVGAMEQDAQRQPTQMTRFVVVVHGRRRWALGPVGQQRWRDPRRLEIRVQEWMTRDAAAVIWTADAAA
jgi:hypothetical protein